MPAEEVLVVIIGANRQGAGFERQAGSDFELKLECALEGIDRFEDFLKRIDCPTHLSELEIDDSLLTRYAQDTLRIIHDESGNLPARPAMTEADIIEVLQSAL